MQNSQCKIRASIWGGRWMPKADGGRDRLQTNDTSLRDTIFYSVKRYFCRRKNDISQSETIFAKARCTNLFVPYLCLLQRRRCQRSWRMRRALYEKQNAKFEPFPWWEGGTQSVTEGETVCKQTICQGKCKIQNSKCIKPVGAIHESTVFRGSIVIDPYTPPINFADRQNAKL